jgi:hypothetical protein
MLWDASAINGYAIEASDGQLGTVSDLLFEDAGWLVRWRDAGWIIRWLVVDTSHWLPGRKVLLPLSALGQPDRALHHFPIKLTMQQVKDSPDVDTDLPVSRQVEAQVHNYLGWDPYWSGSFPAMSNAMATPLVAPLHGPQSIQNDLAAAEAQTHEGDPHLRSMTAITGCHIHASDGEIGHVEDFLVDDAGWNIRYIKIDTRNWWPGERVLISPHSVREIDWAGGLVHLNVNRQTIKDSPPYDPSITVDGAYEEKLLTYYGIRWVAA